MKIRIVYNRHTGKIVPHIWNNDGSVSLTSSFADERSEDDVIVSMVDSNLVDLVYGYVHRENINGKTKK